MSIPKKIHYCWFGRGPKPELALRCIETWKKYCPDYEIIEWNEDNYDLASAPLYVQQAYDAKMWAFVTDYIRLDVILKNGGIYLDTDVELLGSLDRFLEHRAFFGFENDCIVATGLGFGSHANEPILEKIAEDYLHVPFVLPDGTFDMTPCPERNTKVFTDLGLIPNGRLQVLSDSVTVYPADYFNPKSFETGKTVITKNTVSIHHFDGSWISPEKKKEMEEYRKITGIFGVSIGERLLLARNLLRDGGVVALIKRMVSHFGR